MKATFKVCSIRKHIDKAICVKLTGPYVVSVSEQVERYGVMTTYGRMQPQPVWGKLTLYFKPNEDVEKWLQPGAMINIELSRVEQDDEQEL